MTDVDPVACSALSARGLKVDLRVAIDERPRQRLGLAMAARESVEIGVRREFDTAGKAHWRAGGVTMAERCCAPPWHEDYDGIAPAVVAKPDSTLCHSSRVRAIAKAMA